MAVLLSFKEIMDRLRQGSYAPLYLLYGEESYYINTIVAYMETHILSAEERSLNLRICYGKESSLREVISHARCLPMLGKQLIIVKEAQEMTELQQAAGLKVLQSYVEKAPLTTLLVFAYKGALKPGQVLLKALNTAAIRFEAVKVREHQLPQWITAYSAAKGYTITPQAAFMLKELLGNQLQILANELEKIMLNLAPKATIDEALVASHVGLQREMGRFELQRALALCEVEKAFQIVDHFSKNPKKYPAILIIGMLATFFCKVLQLHSLGEKSRQAQAAALQVPPYFLKDYQTAKQHHTVAALCHHIGVLSKIDLQLKGIDAPQVEGGKLLQEAVARILTFPSASR